MTELEIPLQTVVPKIEQQPNGQKVMDVFRARQILLGDLNDEEGASYELPQQPEGGIWEEAAEHTVAAMYVADTLGEAMGLSHKERSQLCQAALLHDSGKKTEQMWLRNVEGRNPKDKTRRVNKSRAVLDALAAMEDAENTLDLGIDPEVSKLMHANVPPVDREQTMQEKIMWFSDAVLQAIPKDGILKQNLVTVKTRFDELEKNPRSVEFSKFFTPTYGRPLFDVQREIGTKYEQEFANILNMSVEEFYTWLQEQVQKKVQTEEVPNF